MMLSKPTVFVFIIRITRDENMVAIAGQPVAVPTTGSVVTRRETTPSFIPTHRALDRTRQSYMTLTIKHAAGILILFFFLIFFNKAVIEAIRVCVTGRIPVIAVIRA
jgi:hypothetical protein